MNFRSRPVSSLVAGLCAWVCHTASPGRNAPDETLPPLGERSPPQNLSELWANFDPDREPLEVEWTKEWEREEIVCRVVRYKVGVFKGAPARVAAFYAFPKVAQSAQSAQSAQGADPGKAAGKLPALLHIHGGGQSASLDTVLTDARRGYASLSLNWGGNPMRLSATEVYEGPPTDWGNLDATHPPQRNKNNHFAGGIAPDSFTLDPVVSPRNDNWFLVTLAARRALSLLQQQPEVDPLRLGVYGHSMGGRLTAQLTGIDPRVKAAVPSCGGSGDVLATETGVPGGRRSKLSPLELATTSENPYLAKLGVPVLWLSPTNDFHADIDNMAHTWRGVPEHLLRLSVSPHFNHRHTHAAQLTQHLWFEAHLRDAFRIPETPRLEVSLEEADGVPRVTVSPSTSLPVEKVEILYSSDPHGLTRFWHTAVCAPNGAAWSARTPLLLEGTPLFVFANVSYETPARYRNLPMAPGQANSETFLLSSRVHAFHPDTLKAAGVRATDHLSRLIDDGAEPWRDWYQLNWGNPSLWSAATRKIKDPKFRGPDGGRLVFEINPASDCELHLKVLDNDWGAFGAGRRKSFVHSLKLRGGEPWQTVSLQAGDFLEADAAQPVPLQNWRTLTELQLSGSGETLREGKKVKVDGPRWKNPLAIRIRNLRWEGGAYRAILLPQAAQSEEALRNGFNDAIRRSLEQEKLDRKHP